MADKRKLRKLMLKRLNNQKEESRGEKSRKIKENFLGLMSLRKQRQ